MCVPQSHNWFLLCDEMSAANWFSFPRSSCKVTFDRWNSEKSPHTHSTSVSSENVQKRTKLIIVNFEMIHFLICTVLLFILALVRPVCRCSSSSSQPPMAMMIGNRSWNRPERIRMCSKYMTGPRVRVNIVWPMNSEFDGRYCILFSECLLLSWKIPISYRLPRRTPNTNGMRWNRIRQTECNETHVRAKTKSPNSRQESCGCPRKTETHTHNRPDILRTCEKLRSNVPR